MWTVGLWCLLVNISGQQQSCASVGLWWWGSLRLLLCGLSVLKPHKRSPSESPSSVQTFYQSSGNTVLQAKSTWLRLSSNIWEVLSATGRASQDCMSKTEIWGQCTRVEKLVERKELSVLGMCVMHVYIQVSLVYFVPCQNVSDVPLKQTLYSVGIILKP